MITKVNIFTDNEFFFFAMVEIFSSHPRLMNEYQLCKINSAGIGAWLRNSEAENEMIMAGPDMETLVRFICLEKQCAYVQSYFTLKEVQRCFNLGKPLLFLERNSRDLSRRHRRPTMREVNIMTCYLAGLTSYQISKRYGISVKTISTYKRRLMDKLHVNSDAELFRAAFHYSMCNRLVFHS